MNRFQRRPVNIYPHGLIASDFPSEHPPEKAGGSAVIAGTFQTCRVGRLRAVGENLACHWWNTGGVTELIHTNTTKKTGMMGRYDIGPDIIYVVEYWNTGEQPP